jgi:hypothetical protein
MTSLLATAVATRIFSLSRVDVVIVVFYFVLVLSIGWYLGGRANTGEDLFMAIFCSGSPGSGQRGG